MERKYRTLNKTVSCIEYHIVLCTRYRRKIFSDPCVEKRFKELVEIRCKELSIEVLSIDCHPDHVCLFLNCLHTFSPYDIAKAIRYYTTPIIKSEFESLSKIPNLWIKNFLVSTYDIDEKTISDFISVQRLNR